MTLAYINLCEAVYMYELASAYIAITKIMVKKSAIQIV